MSGGGPRDEEELETEAAVCADVAGRWTAGFTARKKDLRMRQYQRRQMGAYQRSWIRPAA